MGSPEELDDDPPAFDLTDKDRDNLARKDEDFEPHTWTDLKHIIGLVTCSPLRCSADVIKQITILRVYDAGRLISNAT